METTTDTPPMRKIFTNRKNFDVQNFLYEP